VRRSVASMDYLVSVINGGVTGKRKHGTGAVALAGYSLWVLSNGAMGATSRPRGVQRPALRPPTRKKLLKAWGLQYCGLPDD
jgi:hypothetical protein